MSGPEPYVIPPEDETIDLDLSKNEGLTDGAALLAGISDAERLISRYPDINPFRELLADIHGVSAEGVLVTAGADDSLARCFAALVGFGGRAAATFPTFEMIRKYADQWAVSLFEIPWWRGALPLDGLAEAAEKCGTVFIVSPNNPTGTVMTPEELERLAAIFDTVVLDGAYEEFAEQGLAMTALSLGNVVMVRTLSKAYGLAGLRLGFVLGSPEKVGRISAYGNPYPVSGASVDVAMRRLAAPGDTDAFVTGVRRRREELRVELTALGFDVFPSQGNFVLARGPMAHWLVDGARSLGVALRRYPEEPELADMVRITVPRTDDEMDRLRDVLGVVLSPHAILLDLDGVIVDVSRSQTEAILATASSFGVAATGADVQALKDRGNANNDWDLVRCLCAAAGVDVTRQQVVERYEPLYQGNGAEPGLKGRETALIDPSTLAEWSRRLPLAVVTGRPRADAEEALDRFGLTPFFSTLVAMEDATLKPDAAPVRLALERLGVSRAWMVGDTPDDVRAARGAGVAAIGCIAPGDDEGRARSSLAAAARILTTVKELEELIP